MGCVVPQRELRVSMVLAWLGMVWLCPALPGQNVAAPAYSAKLIEESVPTLQPINLPSLDAFNAEAVAAKLPTKFEGKAALAAAPTEDCLSECFQGKRAKAFAQMQGTSETKIIKVTGGALKLSQIVDQINDANVIDTRDGQTIVRLPILVAADATLVIDGSETGTVRLATDSGAFLANSGKLFVIGAAVSSWNQTANAPSVFTDASQFRPFVTSYAGSETYCADSKFLHLGYYSASSYGFSLTSHPRRHTPESEGNWPTGLIADCVFEGLFYGFYSFEARDVAIINNVYSKNIRYGIDPHDRSTRLIIARNIAEDTVERHGIIGSREVNRSFIFENISRRNAKSGIMLDRQCSGNVVIDNLVYDNGNGVAFYESPGNRLVQNLIAFNQGTAVRLRNSVDALLQENTIVGNAGFAVTCEGRRLNDHEARFERGDTYEMKASADIFDNTMVQNGDGILKGQNLKRIRFGGHNTELDPDEIVADLGGQPRTLPPADNDPLGGDIDQFESEFNQASIADGKMLVIERAGVND